MMLSNIAPAIPVDLNARIHQMIVSGDFRRWRRRTALPDTTPKGLGVRLYLHSYRATTPCPVCRAPVVIRKGRTGYCMKHSQIARRKREHAEFTDRRENS